MKILWLTSFILPQSARVFDIDSHVTGGWLVKLSEELNKKYDMVFVFPQNHSKETIINRKKNVSYYGFYENNKHFERYQKNREKIFYDILKQENPDIVHIWGTEYTYAYALFKTFDCPERTVVNIQGLVSDYANSYYADIPRRVEKGLTFRDLIRIDNIRFQKYKYEKRGKYELEVLRKSQNIVGRTDWDQALAYKESSNAKYYFCNEILRDEFYENASKWELGNCDKYSIFVSQWFYPIKGFHKVIEAVAQLASEYPDIKVYLAGLKLDLNPDIYGKLRQNTYHKYIRTLIKKYHLEDNIISLGKLKADEMVKYMLKSHVFVSASSIENESNSLSEAKLLGVPCVSSYVGGTTNRIKQGYDGFQYQYEKSYMLAFYLKRIFDDDKLATEMGKNASIEALKTNDIIKNTNAMMEIYEKVINKA